MATAGGADAKGGNDKKLQPIIIKRVKKGGHGHHGGAWKIAYADFVTAMMAFFLLMWLLGSTTDGDLRGIAAYFKSPLKVSMSGGRTTGDRTSVIPGGGNDLTQAHGMVKKANSETDEFMKRASERRSQAERDRHAIAAIQAKIEAAVSSNATLNEYRSQIRLDVTPDGLQIQIVDEHNRPMFDIGSAAVKPHMQVILREVGAALGGVENRISLAGHTDATPYGSGERGYSNWELSTDRANASRRELVAAGMPDNKLARVVGLASTDLLLPDNPRAPQNRRITITVLTKEAEERLLGKSPRAAPPVTMPASDFAAEKQDNPQSDDTSPRGAAQFRHWN